MSLWNTRSARTAPSPLWPKVTNSHSYLVSIAITTTWPKARALLGQHLQSHASPVNQLLCKMLATANHEVPVPWPQESHDLQVSICLPVLYCSVFVNILGQCRRKKLLEMRKKQSPPNTDASLQLELPRSRGGDGTYSDLEEHSISTGVWGPSRKNRGCVFHSDARSTWWGRLICFST